jgi:hypothetical protein
MADFSTPLLPSPTATGVISTFGEGATLMDQLESIRQTISATPAVWPAALRAMYYPVVLQQAYVVTKCAWVNGATVNGNVDAAIYDGQGNRLVAAGTTAMAGASVIQVKELTDTTVGPGVVFLAMVSDSATATFPLTTASTAVTQLRASGVQQQALGAMPLPATWTPANPATAVCPILAFTYDNTVI